LGRFVAILATESHQLLLLFQLKTFVMLVFCLGNKTGGCVNKYRFLAFLLSCLCASNVLAQGRISGALGFRTSIKVFSDAEGKQELVPVLVKDVTDSPTVYEISDQGFVRVKVNGQQVWLDRKQVKISLDALEASCLTVNQANANLVSGGIRGANSGCK
jgi:hypothetical protein